jgi:hypothetical protein
MTGIGLPTSPGGGPLEAGPGGGSLRVDPDGALKSGPEGISSPPFRPQAERLSAATATIPNRTVRRQKAKDTPTKKSSARTKAVSTISAR